MTRKALGKGLKALIPEKPNEGSPGSILIPVDSISPNPYQPRKRMAPKPLDDLEESIRSQGLLQPVLLKRSASGYELIAGERRWRASRKAGLKEIPALIKEAGRQDSLAMALVENIQRENLNPVDSALGYQALVQEFGLTQEEVARTVGKDRTSIANYLRLLKLPSSVQEDLYEERLSMGHARALLSLTDRKDQLEIRDRIVAGGLSVRDAEKLVRKAGRRKTQAGRKASPRDPHLDSLESDLKRRLGTKVKITTRRKGGSIQINYHSADEMDRLLDILLGR